MAEKTLLSFVESKKANLNINNSKNHPSRWVFYLVEYFLAYILSLFDILNASKLAQGIAKGVLMKNLSSVIFLSLISLNALSAQVIECNSSDLKDKIIAEKTNGAWSGNYAMNGQLNNGAEVRVEQRYLTSKGLAVSLNVDGQKNKLEVVATAMKANVYKGKMFVERVASDGEVLKISKVATCVVNER